MRPQSATLASQRRSLWARLDALECPDPPRIRSRAEPNTLNCGVVQIFRRSALPARTMDRFGHSKLTSDDSLSSIVKAAR